MTCESSRYWNRATPNVPIGFESDLDRPPVEVGFAEPAGGELEAPPAAGWLERNLLSIVALGALVVSAVAGFYSGEVFERVGVPAMALGAMIVGLKMRGGAA